MNRSFTRRINHILGLSLCVTSSLILATDASVAAPRRPVRGRPAATRPQQTRPPSNQSAPATTVVTLPSGAYQILPDPTRCVLNTAHQLHPGRLIGGRIDRAGRDRPIIRGPIIRQVEAGIAEARAAIARAIAAALVEMKADMLAKISAAFNVGSRVGICDTILANYATEANNKCAANRGRFQSEAAAECSAPGKSKAQSLTCSCLVPAITAALEANCVALAQSPEMLAAVNAAYASCKQREINIGGLLTEVLEQVIKPVEVGQE
ncbi:MAG: hypothetical protein RL326_319 [Pseudomonadota bacterium]